jgi:hypothetical protein
VLRAADAAGVKEHPEQVDTKFWLALYGEKVAVLRERAAATNSAAAVTVRRVSPADSKRPDFDAFA